MQTRVNIDPPKFRKHVREVSVYTKGRDLQKVLSPLESIRVEIFVELFAPLCPPTEGLGNAIETRSRAPVERTLNVIRSSKFWVRHGLRNDE